VENKLVDALRLMGMRSLDRVLTHASAPGIHLPHAMSEALGLGGAGSALDSMTQR
jgi:hypothetical protein